MSEALATAVKAAIDAQLGTAAASYDIDDVPGLNGNTGTLPFRYVEIGVSRRYTEPDRGDAMPSFIGYRITTRAVAKNITDARNLRRLTGLALENKALTVSGQTSTPVAFETEDPIAPDEDRYSGLTYWTTVI